MATEKNKSKRSGSLFGSWVNRFTAFIYALFAHGGVISSFSREDSYDKSFCSQALERTARSAKKGKAYKFLEHVIEKSKPLQVFSALRVFFACLSLQVYGIFTLCYAVTSIFIHYIKILVSGNNDHGLSAVIMLAVMAVCAIPMLMSSSSATRYVSESRILRPLTVSLLGISAEKLKPTKRFGGVGYMFSFAFLGVFAGLATYFIYPAYIIVVGIVIAGLLVISSNPESGVVATVLATPFLQYSVYAEFILSSLVLATIISYVSKIIKRRRVIQFTAESVLLFIFCGFILVASIYSKGGTKTFLTAIMAVIVTIGGFITSYNLMRGDRKRICIRIIAISFSILTVIGVWNVFYDAVVDGVMYSMRDYVQPIFEGNNIYIKDSTDIFSVFAILASPLVFSRLTKQKRVKNVVLWLVLLGVLMMGVFIYGTRETVIALVLEFCIFWVIYSHKTLNAVIFMLIPVGILVIAYPYISSYLDLQSVREIIKGMLPLGFPDAPSHVGIVESTMNMLGDGNLSGIGVGKHAYQSAMVGYTDQISAGATNPASFWLQVICWSGIGGFVTFIMIIGLIFKKSLGYMSVSGDKKLRTDVLALSCSLFVALIFGGVCCLWSDMRMLYLFWVVAGLIAGCVREGREADQKISAELSDETDRTDIDIRI